MITQRVYLFDTTLRDGAQTHGVDFSVFDKLLIIEKLDQFGIDYIEAGFPGTNPTDEALFANAPRLHHAHLTAFGMTRRSTHRTDDDPLFSSLLNTPCDAICLVGKTWDFQVKVALGIQRDENLTMIEDSITAAQKQHQTLFDAEHFFDGYKADPAYALECLKVAYKAGAKWIVLCDTNGGTLPYEIDSIVENVQAVIPGSSLGIHTHNDTGNAIANSLIAVKAGVHMVQGTINGLGERCGNANLITLIPTLMFKMGYTTGISSNHLKQLVALSRTTDEYLGRPTDIHAPYVGKSAFAHKGGLHASGVEKNSSCYEHIDPTLVGNQRIMVISDQAGRANILAWIREKNLNINSDDPRILELVQLIKDRDYEGYAYETASASFDILAYRMLKKLPEYFELIKFSVTDERRYNALGNLVTESQAIIKVRIGSEITDTVSEGNGPVNAIDLALRNALLPFYPCLSDMQLIDYRVRILHANDASGAMPRVLIESIDSHTQERWSTIGVSTNIIDASFGALVDSFTYKLLREKITPSQSSREQVQVTSHHFSLLIIDASGALVVSVTYNSLREPTLLLAYYQENRRKLPVIIPRK